MLKKIVFALKKWIILKYYPILYCHAKVMEKFVYTNYGIFAKAFEPDALDTAKFISKSVCDSSGMCAAKSWEPSQDMKQKMRELAHRASLELDPIASAKVMNTVANVFELSPEEKDARLKAFASINKGEGYESNLPSSISVVEYPESEKE